MNVKELSRQVLKRRREMGLSQEDLAQKADISRNYISLIERGEARNVSLNILDRLATALGTTLAELTGESNQESILISPALREFGLIRGLSFKTVNWLAQMPRRGPEPKTAEEWGELYEAIRPFIEEED